MMGSSRRWVSGPALDLARAARRPVESRIVGASTIGAGPFFDAATFDWARRLEAGQPTMRRELEQLVADGRALQTSHDLTAVSSIRADLWSTIVLSYYGRTSGVARRCAATMALLEGVPGLRAASFSILWPGGEIPPHRGPYAGVVRYHLGLIVPRPPEGCGIRVGDQIRHWEEGCSLVFDESFEHEAWNTTDGMRAVLFLDIDRPLRQPARRANAAALALFAASPYVRSTQRRNAAWESAQGLTGTD